MKLTTIKNKNDMSLSAKLLAEGSEAIAKYETIEDCIYTYKNAETIVDSWFEVQRDGAVSLIRSKAIYELKFKIMGNLADAHLASVPQDLVDAWYKGLGELGLIGTNGQQSNSVIDLLRFANYNETARLSGVKIVAPNVAHLNCLTTLMFNKRGKGNKADMIEVSKTYAVLAKEYNSGKPFKSASDVKTAFEKFEGQVLPKKPKKVVEVEEEEEATVSVREIFESEVGVQPEVTLGWMEFPEEVMKNLPDTNREEFKKFYRYVANVIHPDKGGDASMTAILTQLNKMMNVVFNHIDEKTASSEWTEDYNTWKDDNNYTSEYMPESEIKG